MAGVTIDPAALAAFVADGNGPVMRHLMVVGERVKQNWIAQMPEGFVHDFFAGKIVKRVVSTDGKPSVRVGTDTVKTEPHPIDGNPLLVFDVGGFTVFTTHVDHPGSDFSDYLTRTGKQALANTKGS